MTPLELKSPSGVFLLRWVLAVGWLASWWAQGATFTVTSTNDAGVGTLRQAILNANDNPGLDRIVFAIPGTSTPTIQLTYGLPQITDPVVLDGSTQTGYTPNHPVVEINGSLAHTNASGLILLGGSNEVRNLIINGFWNEGVQIQAYGGNRVAGCFIGTDRLGMSATGNVNGIVIHGSQGNIIGGSEATNRNLISGNYNAGLLIIGPLATSNQVVGNYIGVNATGLGALKNGWTGVGIQNAPTNQVGSLVAGNLISGNAGNAVAMIGPNASGNSVFGNLVGTDYTGRAVLSNGSDGIRVEGAAYNQIGGTNVGARNVISGNGGSGIVLASALTVFNTVSGNYLGVDAGGTNRLGNSFWGIAISSASSNQIGGLSAGSGNLISGNILDGVVIGGSGAHDNVLWGNLIGTDYRGLASISNRISGVDVVGGMRNYIGGEWPGAGNLISGNHLQGVFLRNTISNYVQGNFIGTDITGRQILSNGTYGVLVNTGATNTFIGSEVPAGRNIISGNLAGVLLNVGSSSNFVCGNYIGTDVAGTNGLGNKFYGVHLFSTEAAVIGNGRPGGGNVIAANGFDGIRLESGVNHASILGNYVGCDFSGTRAIPNGPYNYSNSFGGITLINSSSNRIGGPLAWQGNLISGNGYYGLYITNGAGNVVQGNWLGVKPDGVSALPNAYHVIFLDVGAVRNVIGGVGPGEGNRIAYAGLNSGKPGYDGVRIFDNASQNAVRGNTFFKNGLDYTGLAIDLGVNGPTANATGTPPASAANNGQNYPIITSVSGLYLCRIKGTFNSLASQSFTLDFYRSTLPSTSTNFQGEIWLGARTISTDSSGNASFDYTFTNALAALGVVGATATDSAGNTSEFSYAMTNLTTLASLADANSDGIPDEYAVAFGFNPLATIANLDVSGAGMTVLQALRAGVSPTDAQRALRVTGVTRTNGMVYVDFPTVQGRSYVIEGAMAVKGPWSALSSTNGVAGNGAGNELRATWSSTTNGYFRVRSF